MYKWSVVTADAARQRIGRYASERYTTAQNIIIIKTIRDDNRSRYACIIIILLLSLLYYGRAPPCNIILLLLSYLL